MSEPTAPTEVDFHFDVMCPFAYQTSKWIRAVREQNGLTINWKFFSLERSTGKRARSTRGNATGRTAGR